MLLAQEVRLAQQSVPGEAESPAAPFGELERGGYSTGQVPRSGEWKCALENPSPQFLPAAVATAQRQCGNVCCVTESLYLGGKKSPVRLIRELVVLQKCSSQMLKCRHDSD